MKTDFDQAALVAAAHKAAEAAYAPYSKFPVGAALLTAEGRIFTGCNVENASYGLTICAERSAVFKAVSEGEREFVAIAVCVPGGGMPCGACRQVLHEFSPEAVVVVADEHRTINSNLHLSELLPKPFGGLENDI